MLSRGVCVDNTRREAYKGRGTDGKREGEFGCAPAHGSLAARRSATGVPNAVEALEEVEEDAQR